MLMDAYLYFKELKVYIWFAVFLFLTAALLGYFTTVTYTEEALRLQQELNQLGDIVSGFSSLAFFLFIFFNNAIKIFLTILLGAGFAVFPLVFVFSNGYFIGAVGVIAGRSIGFSSFLVSIAPHGILELPAFLFASAIGIMIGAKVIKNIFGRAEFEIKKEILRGLKLFFQLILPVVFIAAFIEAFITPVFINIIL